MVPQFYNSLTKQRELLNPKDPGKIRIYNCGPTVYKRQHLGNMRRFLFADFLRRTLELFGYEVREVTNITDVGHLTQDDIDAGEDKVEVAARQQQKTPDQIVNEQIKLFQQDLADLNIQPAHKYPRASGHIKQMQDLIAALLKRGHAYQTKSGVYFDVTTFPNYGQLSGNTLDKIAAGARVEVRQDKKHPADFALWKTDDPQHLQQWDSPWGRGYPGWHIECSAMSLEYLGNDIDIHTGGEDNRFPHHENEIAQSEGAIGQPFVRHWMHNRHLLFSGAKLAKREGQQLTLDTLKEKNFSPLAFRLLVFGSHYRSPLDFSWEAMHQAQENLERIKHLLRRLVTLSPPYEGGVPASTAGGVVIGASSVIDPFPPPEAEGLPLRKGEKKTTEKFFSALADDLNTPAALAVVMDFIHEANKQLDSNGNPVDILATLHAFDRVLGIIGPLEQELEKETIPADIQQLVNAREQARRDKKFARADELREEIELKGYTLEDTPAVPRIMKK